MTSNASSPVQLHRDGAVAHIEFSRPQAMNALDVPTVEAFFAICKAIAPDPGVRAIVISGQGRGFGVGGDLAAMQAGDPTEVAGQLISNLHGGIELLAAKDAPVIGRLHGAVAGGSMSLALSCDLAIAAEGTTFNLAYARIGASCDGSSSYHLPRLVGLRRAMAIALLSESIGAEEALELGLVNRVVPAADLEAETTQLAHRLADGPTLAYGRIKRLLRQSLDNDLHAQLRAEAEGFADGTRTADFKEGLAAFFAKRAPVYEGR